MSHSRMSRIVHRCGLALFFFSALLWTVTTVCFIGVWDHVAAITTFPQWSWALIGIVTALLAHRLLNSRARLALLLLLLWLLTTLYFADNLLPVLREFVHGRAPKLRADGATLRVVTLNCASSSAAAGEVMKFQPDVVLLQESPTSNKIAQLAGEWFGDTASLVTGLDCAIISHFPLKPLEEHSPIHYIGAVLVLPQKRELLVTSLRLTPPIGATDLWRPATWRAYLEDRRLRREQLRSALEAAPGRPDLPAIIGGDFNAPAGDGIYKLLHQYRDSHRVSGRGWETPH